MFNNLTKAIGLSSVLFAAGVVATPSMASPTMTVPVLKHNMRSGDIISATDLTQRQVDLRYLPRDTVLKSDALLGREAVRTLRPGMPIQSTFVRVPPAARRGETVKLRFDAPGIGLEARGEALQDGHKGERIRVMNLASNKIIEGTVTAEGIVTVE